jgi:hypothetical protein
VAIEGVYDQVQDLADFGFEGMGRRVAHWSGFPGNTGCKLATLRGLSTRAQKPALCGRKIG